MIIKIKKRDLTILLLLLLLLLLVIPVVYAGIISRYFTVVVSVGNRGPRIINVSTTTVTLTEGTTVTVQIGFNVSDDDGFGDLDDSSAKVNVTLNSVIRNSSSCTPNDYNTNYTHYICDITFYYYDNSSSSWNINVSVSDSSGNQTSNSTLSLTINSLSSMNLVRNLTFSGVNLGQQDKAPDNEFMLNNTGNFDFTEINITGYDLVGVSDPSYKIGVGNFTVNTTNAQAGVGLQLQNATNLTIPGATLPHILNATSDVSGNETLYFWLDVPASSEISSQSYNSSTNSWVITVK